MQAEDRPIHFSTELIHPPKRHEKTALQRLYFELSQTRGAAYDSTDFTPPGPPKFYSKRGKKSQSLALFLPDRFVIVEEWCDMSLAEFLDKTESVADRVIAELGIGPIAIQTATIRTTFALTHFDDARAFLLDRACCQTGRIAPHFNRPILVGGLRFVLPETPEHPGTLHVTIESFQKSLNEVYVEVKGIFPNQRIDRTGLATLRSNMLSVRAFISDSVYPFLDQYDSPEEGLV
ncbi:MAG: hypothetical protein JXR94_19915 [Candidatus Hydrogenedentes bacterium]|nr:hypothetical protein [Candidatus Hydrogenedentota bacterium]